MSGHKSKTVVVLCLLLIIGFLLNGCGSLSIKNVDIEPPTTGLLDALQKDKMPSQTEAGYKVKVTESSGNSFEKGKMDIQLEVTDAAGVPVTRFSEDMTKLMHLIVISKDLSSFQHVHPELGDDYKFRAQLDFPFGSSYLVTTEFRPYKEDVVTYRQWIDVNGDEQTNITLMPDTSFVKEVNGLDVELSASPTISEIEAGQMVMLLFRMKDKATGKSVKQLEPFLGTSGHCVILNSTGEQYVHAHAMEAMSEGGNVMFHTVFPEKGIYKLWGQFQYEGELMTIPFVISVN